MGLHGSQSLHVCLSPETGLGDLTESRGQRRRRLQSLMQFPEEGLQQWMGWEPGTY